MLRLINILIVGVFQEVRQAAELLELPTLTASSSIIGPSKDVNDQDPVQSYSPVLFF